MQALTRYFTQEEGDASTVNVKRTTLMTFLSIVFVMLLAVSLLAFYASFKAMSAANAVDEAWQNQVKRILDTEANSVQARADAKEAIAMLGSVQQAMIDSRSKVQQLQKDVAQAIDYRRGKDQELADAKARALAAQADAQREQEAAEKKGVENFDRLLLNRLHSHWVRPESATTGTSVEVVVEFQPNGTITNATVPDSSGNKEVDQSVIKAAATLAKIPELATVDSRIFMKYLQQRRVRFEM
ncbi:TonB family protein [Pseudomonas guariconensis]|uniref:TonB family protein n=1 Tax=Pseudomonas guariconensis TaxID=1288410 RepID=UPI0039060D30